jgi:hypothetical protein
VHQLAVVKYACLILCRFLRAELDDVDVAGLRSLNAVDAPDLGAVMTGLPAVAPEVEDVVAGEEW